MGADNGDIFSTAVDPADVPGYDVVVTQPMDLSRVKQNLSKRR